MSSSALTAPKTEAADIPPKEVVPLSKPELQSLAYEVATENGLNAKHFVATIDCETGGTWDANIQSTAYSRTDPGHREESFGLAQIHLPDHLDIRKVQATDPRFAIRYMASEWLAGHQTEWSCWSMKYGSLQ